MKLRHKVSYIRKFALFSCPLKSAGRDAGVILNIPERYTKGEEGARAAATRYGSTFGLGIKVSHDGPITVYEHGVPVRHIA
jgi:hypothetical protein